jgi:hypothetical protein
VEDRPSARDRMRITWRGTYKSAGPVAGIGTASELMIGCGSSHGVIASQREERKGLQSQIDELVKTDHSDVAERERYRSSRPREHSQQLPVVPLWPKPFQTQACTMVGRCLAAVWQ